MGRAKKTGKYPQAMNESDMNNSSETNWEMVDALTDETIDRSELPPLDDSFFDRATWRMPKEPVYESNQKFL